MLCWPSQRDTAARTAHTQFYASDRAVERMCRRLFHQLTNSNISPTSIDGAPIAAGTIEILTASPMADADGTTIAL